MISVLKENSLLIMLTIATIFTFIWLYLLRDRLRMSLLMTLALSILHVVYGVFTVKIFAIIEGFGDLSVVGNMSLFGGVFMMPIGYYIGAKLAKRKTSEVFDIFSICMISTVMFARINCIIGGCCQGRFLPGSTSMRWPTREAEIIFYLILLAYLIPRIWKNKTNGEAYPFYVFTYGCFRFVCECFRVSEKTDSIWHLSHIWAIIAMLIGLSVYLEMLSSTKKRNRR